MTRPQLTKLVGTTWMCFAAGLIIASGGTLESWGVLALAALIPPLMLLALAGERAMPAAVSNLPRGAKGR